MSETQHDHLPKHIRPGSSFGIGSHTFLSDDIIRFAKSWDPQPFHTNAEKAKESLLGGLCASGWHTVSIWMKLQRVAIADRHAEIIKAGEQPPEFGPSPGMRNIKWLVPVFAGDTITYSNNIESIRESGSKPGWSIMSNHVCAKNQHGKTVMTFSSAVFIKLG
jgi:acyl dehydratase